MIKFILDQSIGIYKVIKLIFGHLLFASIVTLFTHNTVLKPKMWFMSYVKYGNAASA